MFLAFTFSLFLRVCFYIFTFRTCWKPLIEFSGRDYLVFRIGFTFIE